MTKPIEIRIIRSARELAGIESDRELCEETGINYATFAQKRVSDPGSLHLCEIRQLIKHTKMTDEMILALVKGHQGGRS